MENTLVIQSLKQILNFQQKWIEEHGVTYVSSSSEGNTHRFELNGIIYKGREVKANLHGDGNLGGIYIAGDGAGVKGEDVKRCCFKAHQREWLANILMANVPPEIKISLKFNSKAKEKTDNSKW